MSQLWNSARAHKHWYYLVVLASAYLNLSSTHCQNNDNRGKHIISYETIFSSKMWFLRLPFRLDRRDRGWSGMMFLGWLSLVVTRRAYLHDAQRVIRGRWWASWQPTRKRTNPEILRQTLIFIENLKKDFEYARFSLEVMIIMRRLNEVSYSYEDYLR